MAKKKSVGRVVSSPAASHGTDIFTGTPKWQTGERFASVDERSAIIEYAIAPNANFKSTHQAVDIKLEVDRHSIPDRITIGKPGLTGVANSQSTSWHVIDFPSGPLTMQKSSGPQVFKIEVKTGLFAALETSPTASVSKATLQSSSTMDSAPVGRVNLRIRLSCQYEPITARPPTRVQDLATLSFNVID